MQTRLGIEDAQSREPRRYPAILLETMADCYAGVAFAQPALQAVGGLAPDARVADDALLALVGFGDPPGVEPGDDSAHGDGFDRISAFQDGFRDGAARCAAMTTDNRAFTQRRFGSAADRARAVTFRCRCCSMSCSTTRSDGSAHWRRAGTCRR